MEEFYSPYQLLHQSTGFPIISNIPDFYALYVRYMRTVMGFKGFAPVRANPVTSKAEVRRTGYRTVFLDFCKNFHFISK